MFGRGFNGNSSVPLLESCWCGGVECYPNPDKELQKAIENEMSILLTMAQVQELRTTCDRDPSVGPNTALKLGARVGNMAYGFRTHALQGDIDWFAYYDSAALADAEAQDIHGQAQTGCVVLPGTPTLQSL